MVKHRMNFFRYRRIFFHKAYDETLKPAFGNEINADDVVVEGKEEQGK